MTKEQKNDVIEVLKDKFSQYNNFYVTNTESLTVAQVSQLRRVCFDKQVEMKVAKNTLIKKALESLFFELCLPWKNKRLVVKLNPTRVQKRIRPYVKNYQSLATCRE